MAQLYEIIGQLFGILADHQFDSFTIAQLTVDIPEPSSIALFILGLTAIGFASRKRNI